MTIIIDIRPVLSSLLCQESKEYITRCLEYLIRERRQDRFYFITGYPAPDLKHYAFIEHTIPVKLGLKGRIAGHPGYPQKLAPMLKKYGEAVFLSTSGIAGRDTPMRQLVWLPFEAGVTRPSPAFGKLWNRNLKRSCLAAEKLFVSCEKQKERLLNENPDISQKIHFVRPAANPQIAPLDPAQKELFRQKFSGGKEYFLSEQAGEPESGFLDILKAFSLFKKRQLSNMQMVLTGIDNRKMRKWKEKIDSYKYRKDLHFLAEPASSVQGLVESAYAFLPAAPGPLAILNCFQAGVPLIAKSKDLNADISGECLLFREEGNLEQLAGLLMSVYKNEKMRNELIRGGIKQAAKFSWMAAAEQLWAGLLPAPAVPAC